MEGEQTKDEGRKDREWRERDEGRSVVDGMRQG